MDRPANNTTAFRLIVCTLLVLIAGTELPTPLYVAYQQRFGFADSTLTLVFAVYALALIPMLMWCGRIADRVGQLPVIATGMLAAAVGAFVLASADGVAALLIGRAVQGIAVGIATGASTAALSELVGGRSSAPLWATVAVAGGGAGGPLLAGWLAQYGPWPFVLCYLIQIAVLIILLVGLMHVRAAFVRQPTNRVSGLPGVPRAIRAPFATVGLVVFTAWAVGGLYTAVVPAYVTSLLGTADLALLGAVPFLMLATAAATQLTMRTIANDRAQLAGLGCVTAGLGALVIAFPMHALVWVAISAVLDGVGLGLAFLGAQSRLAEIAPDGRRAEVSGAFNVCLYLGVALPVLGTGFVADATSLLVAVIAFSILIAVLAAGAAVAVVRTRRQADRRMRAALSR